MAARRPATDGTGRSGRVTAIGVFEHGSLVRAGSVGSGRIAQVWGLDGVRIGDAVGIPPPAAGRHFAPPTLETVVVPRRPADRAALHAALTRLAEQDPLINLRQDDVRREIAVSLYGEVQKEVIQATLAGEFGVDVTFRETTTICVERPVGTGEAVETIGADGNPFLATVGLRVDPAPPGAGVEFRVGVELGALPLAFVRAVEETVRGTLRQGLHGWEVVDCVVTMTHSGYWARQSHSHGVFDKSMSSTAGDFRHLAPLVLTSALRRAGTRVEEPIHRVRLDVPADTVGPVARELARLGGAAHATTGRGTEARIEGELPAVRVHDLRRRLPSLTHGEGVLDADFRCHRPVRGTPPSRPRTDHDPLDRAGYLLRVQRRLTS